LSTHYNGRKINGVIPPQIIFSSPSVINITKEKLIRILKKENEIRLPEESNPNLIKLKRVIFKFIFGHDYEMIESAFIPCGYNPRMMILYKPIT
jgi:hypothetical protein